MNMTISETKDFLAQIKDKIDKKNDVAFCVPTISLESAILSLKDIDIGIGVQNIHEKDSGAYTGETAAKMVKDAGATYALVGHSERRQYFGETCEWVNLKAIQAIKHDLIPIICVGETETEREQGITSELIKKQIKIAFLNIPNEDAIKCVIAYEPVWAIGTGKTATTEQAEEVCKLIRETIEELYGLETAQKIRILYGGSVNASNAKELFSMENIDGGLVGGASLSLDFINITNA
ncbi:MAG: triose-phosphate isomerase [Defluviitaleaceae bacterium]|nr:triose-phosphate isomerase [Defluviitaleaceae bacterium]